MQAKTKKIDYHTALAIAERVKAALEPHCERIAIAGSIRRQRPQVSDIEIVAIPKSYQVGLFASGIAPIVNEWQKVKGELPCKYTQRILPEGIKLDLFFAEPGNWGYIMAIRTGSAAFSKMLAQSWKQRGYQGENGYLTHKGRRINIKTEEDLFCYAGVKYVEPEKREL